MKKEIAEKWVKALESGTYLQGTGYLRKHGRYCCLGVLCDVHQKETDAKEWHNEKGTWRYDSVRLELPLSVQKWSGMSDVGGYGVNLGKEGSESNLMALNDRSNHDFKDIAKVIREHWETL